MIPQAPKDLSGPTDLAGQACTSPPRRPLVRDVIVNTDLHRTHSQQSCTILSWLVRRTTFGARLTLLCAVPTWPSHQPTASLPHPVALLSTHLLSNIHLCMTSVTLTHLLTDSLRGCNMLAPMCRERCRESRPKHQYCIFSRRLNSLHTVTYINKS